MEVNPSMIREDFGLHLKSIRRYNNLTQKQIAQKLNISRQAYSNYEQGRCIPTPDTLASLSIILKTDLFSFFLYEASKKIPQNETSNEIKEKKLSLTRDEYNILNHLYSKLSVSEKINLLINSNYKSKESEASTCCKKHSLKY